ncbi:MAG TPA: amidohydrolase family protein, partial [Kiritimatiellia bacterium]|nr:amidohydrolase family protein [Kiritimatiellia bacterium]
LIWSPMSNMKLYAGTANVRAAKQAGVTIAISPDWTPSGCYNILEELGYAWQLNTTIFSNAFTAREMCDMVTLNGAKCAGLDGHYGKIAVGYNAGLAVIEGDTADPYMALIRARTPNMLLTIVDGTPRYGDPALMAALGVTGESVDVRGHAKKLNIAVAHPFLDFSRHTFATIHTNLVAAHGTLSPINELDREELQFLDFSLLQGDGGDDVAPFRADSPLSSAPSTTVTNDVGGSLSMSFRYQDFWDNDTFITNLTHTISIAPARYSNLIVQTIATNRANTLANQTVPFTVGFRDMHTNYVFVFETRDARGNVRTTVSTNVFKVKTYTGGDTDRDGLPNEWEIQYFGGFSNAAAAANADGDWLNNYQEYVADTAPNNSNSVMSAGIDVVATAGNQVLEIASPMPTSTGRVYDVWRTTNLLGTVAWTPLNLNVRGAAAGTAVVLRVTNTLPAATYRTGVKLP